MFFKKKKQKRKEDTNNLLATSIQTVENKKEKGLNINDLFWNDFDVFITKANEIIIEVYRESKMEENWEAPGTFIGIRIIEDGTLKEDIPLHDYANYGLFSFMSTQRHSSEMKFAIHIADFIVSNIMYGYETYDFKIKKRFVSTSHIYLLEIPPDYEVTMPEPSEHLKITLEFQIRENDLHRKKLLNPNYDITEEKKQWLEEFTEYRNKYYDFEND